MENLIFSLNATLPIFLTMILGWFFRKTSMMDEAFVQKMNKFVFQAALPVLVFQDLATVDFAEVWDIRFVLFCFLATLISILAVTGFSYFFGRQAYSGRVYPGILPQQRGDPGNCFYPEYLRGRRDGAADDHCYGAAVQYHGSSGAHSHEA